MTHPTLPLQGVRMLAMAPWLPGLFCTLLLADLGAEVILVEHPAGKERKERPPGFLPAINRNKRSLAVDLNSPEGKEIIHKLAARSDVFIEGFRPGTAKRMGMGYDILNQLNPRIIYCSLSGYGQDGPYSDLPAHNNSYMGIAGMICTLPKSEPIYNRYLPVADLCGSMFAALDIMAALRHRDLIHRGQYLDVSIMDCTVSWMSSNLGMFFATGGLRPKTPASDFYQTKDGNYIGLSVGPTDSLWRNLCRALGREDLADLTRQQREDRFEELEKTLAQLLLSRTRDDWMDWLTANDVPASPVLSIDQIEFDPQVRHRGLIQAMEENVEGAGKQVSHPVKFSESPLGVRKTAPSLGEDTEEILQEMGYTKEEIQRLKLGKIIGP